MFPLNRQLLESDHLNTIKTMHKPRTAALLFMCIITSHRINVSATYMKGKCNVMYIMDLSGYD